MKCDVPENPNKLKVVHTARTEKAINRAVKDGFRPLMKPVVPGEDIADSYAVYQHKHTGIVRVVGDVRVFFNGNEEELKAEYDCILPWASYYPYHFPSPFAAYLIPPDLKAGERVWLADIIEDIVYQWGNQGDNPRLEAYEATWDGKDFTIHFDPETVSILGKKISYDIFRRGAGSPYVSSSKNDVWQSSA